MAFTLEEIVAYLKNDEMKFDIDKEKHVLRLGLTDGNEKGLVTITAQEDGELFSLYMDPMNENNEAFDIPLDHPHLNLVLPQLLFANFRTKFGTWEYDPRDGDLRFAIEFPVEDGTITQNQFNRIINCVTSMFEFQAKFRHILEKGSLPSEKNEDDELLALLEKVLGQFKAEETKESAGKEGNDGI